MPDSVLLALITGLLAAASAITASWVVGQGNIRTAQATAETEASRARAGQLRDSRRVAYAGLLDFVGTMKWRLIAAMNLAIAHDESGVQAIMHTRNDMVAELQRHRTVVLLDGPHSIEGAALTLSETAVKLMLDLERGLIANQSDLEAHLLPSVSRLDEATNRFLHDAQIVLGTS